MVADVANEAIETAGIADHGDLDAFVSIGTRGEPEITVAIYGQHDDAYITDGFDGELLHESGSLFRSEQSTRATVGVIVST